MATKKKKIHFLDSKIYYHQAYAACGVGLYLEWLTDSWPKVTCKNCLKKKPANATQPPLWDRNHRD